ncbi:MAG: type II secretion system protein GspE, partial [Nocardioidaceae bacterium]|nr:type II secretion system protein GspE [Nocardioidaceae bacterium]
MKAQSDRQTVNALVASGLVTPAQLDDAERTAAGDSRSVLEILLDTGTVHRNDVVRTAAASVGLEYVDLTEYAVDMNAAALLPADFVRRSSVLPLRIEHGELVVAVAVRQAGNIELKDDLSRMANRRVRFAIANRGDIDSKINQVYRAEGELAD